MLMIELLKSLVSPRDLVMIISVGMITVYLTSTFTSKQIYSLREEKKALKEALKQADEIIYQEQLIIDAAILSDSIAGKKIDSIQILRDENDTITFKLSDIDSIRNLWPSH